MKRIKLTQGQFALVDDDMFEELNKFKWRANRNGNTFYAVRSVRVGKEKIITISMHRVILGLTDSKIQCDHINHNGLNNQKSNLRACTGGENQRNRKANIGCSSKFKGVRLNRRDKNWRASIYLDKKSIHIGYFTNEIEAAKAYDKAATLHYGEFANINFKKIL